MAGNIAFKRNMAGMARSAAKHHQQPNNVLEFQHIGPNDIFLPQPYDPNPPMTYGTGKSLTLITGKLDGGVIL